MPRNSLGCRRMVLSLAALAFGSPAFAAGVASLGFSCGDLQALIAQHGFVFINNPDFEDFVVASRNFCGTSMHVQLRSVPTADRPECPVNYCVRPGGSGN
jgi:hypothetical protein